MRATTPSAKVLVMGRQWHLFFAWLLVFNGLFFVAYVPISRHATRDMAPTGKELRGISKAIKDYIVPRIPKEMRPSGRTCCRNSPMS
jgi:thiosulfate reductase cytochrome b subunit